MIDFSRDVIDHPVLLATFS